MPYTEADIKHFIDTVNDGTKIPLTPWEVQFMENITDRVERGFRLTDDQIAVLDRIYTHKTD